MSQTQKAELYALFKQVAEPTKHYREYSTSELADLLNKAGVDWQASIEPPPTQNEADPNEMPSQRLNTKADDEVIRVDEQGRQWYQEEVQKPAYPKPRGRRVLKYLDTGVEKRSSQAGEYVETFEVAGNGVGRPAEIKITLPSYQVGIYKDPRFPFKIHCYNGREGFDMFEVQDYYGGSELVPPQVKRVYIENDLCYDIRSVIRAINEEHRALMLSGRIK